MLNILYKVIDRHEEMEKFLGDTILIPTHRQLVSVYQYWASLLADMYKHKEKTVPI